MRKSAASGLLLPPANEVCEGYVFTGVCLSTGGGGLAWLVGGVHSCQGVVHGCGGGCVWLLGGMKVVGGGACMVAGVHVWLWTGVRGCQGMLCSWGYVWLPEGVHGCWGVCVVAGVACMVAGEHAWLLGGHAWLQGACMVVGGMHGCRGACIGYDEIQSMSGWYASYWNAFLLMLLMLMMMMTKNFSIFRFAMKNPGFDRFNSLQCHFHLNFYVNFLPFI